jgi:ubiquinone/menaquinone biosynthesis C-methylase UbiE
MDKTILDACCGSRMFWFDKQNKNTIFMDNRKLEDTLCDNRKLVISPDVIADFRNIPFPSETFKLVVFDPPHLLKIGESSWMAKKYGKLNDSWPQDIKQGFNECMRVLEPFGVLIFKWNEEQIKLKQILDLIEQKPLFGDQRSKTHWLVFMKSEIAKNDN